jgi:hypothetical protein
MFRRLTIRLPRRSVLVTAIALWLVGALGPLAVARTATVAPANPVATGFQPASMAFFDADHGIVGGTILCPTCIKHRTGAISTTADGGHTWSAPTTFLSAAATGLTVVPGGLDAWALVGTRLEHSSDRGATWSFRSNVGVTDPSFATATTGSGIRRTTVASTVVESLDGGATWNAGPAPATRCA